jgi:hypothetical protein
MYAIEPVQRLRLLKLRHRILMNEREFQTEMATIFITLRDLHTNYVLPSEYQRKFAFLPFRIEEFYEKVAESHVRKFIISWISPINTNNTLKEGMIVTHWNGSPIELAVARNAEREAGSNSEARRARGIEALTLRWFGMSHEPDEDWVLLTYSDGTKTYESRFDWEIIDRPDLAALLKGSENNNDVELALGIDVKTAILQQLRTNVFDAHAIRANTEVSEIKAAALQGNNITALESSINTQANVSIFPDMFPRFGKVETPSGAFGYVRLQTFLPNLPSPVTLAQLLSVRSEFIRILNTLPPSGLILDVRGNGGGYVLLPEIFLQLLTPRPVVPIPFHFLTTRLTLEMARHNGLYTQWKDSIAQAIEIGADFSQGFPITSATQANDVGQIYQGPVLLITDAFCYSATDLFVATAQDHEAAFILGTNDNLGAGGANVVDSKFLQGLTISPKNPFVALPKGVNMRVALRRMTRNGGRSGVPIEDLGVVPDKRHYMTKDDVLHHNVDLIAHAAEILASQLTTQSLELIPNGIVPISSFTIKSTNVDRLDLFIDGRPVLSQDVTNSNTHATTTITLPAPLSNGSVLTANGFRENKLVVSKRYRA